MPNPFAFSISRDGRMISFAARDEGVTKLFVRPIDSDQAWPLPGTEGASGRPFWSPDSRFVGFWDARTRQLKLTGAGGGSPRLLIGDIDSFGGGTWGSENTIIFSAGRRLYRVAAAGGKAVALPHLQADEGLFWPQFLPDGRRFLYFLFLATDQSTHRWAVIGSLDSKEETRLMESESRTEYVQRDLIVFARQHTLFAQSFDSFSLRLAGEPAVLAEHLVRSGPNAAFDVSDQGTLIYRRGRLENDGDRSLVWLDRTGTITGQIPVGQNFTRGPIRLSPDGRRVAFSEANKGAPEDVSLYDFESNLTTSLTNNPATDHQPIWSPDGSRVAFDSTRGRDGSHVIYEKRSDGATPEQILVPPEPGMTYGVLDWNHEFIVFSKNKLPPGPTSEIWAQRLSGDKRPFRYIQDAIGPFGDFSPDGRRLAYVSIQGGRPQVIVQSFPDGSHQREQISRTGGEAPRWRRDGRELFYIDDSSRMMAVPVEADGTISVARTTELFATPSGGGVGNAFDVTPDGQRFLFSVESGALEPTSPINVVVNWPATLKK
jgi:Tol biopolymer transport system component